MIIALFVILAGVVGIVLAVLLAVSGILMLNWLIPGAIGSILLVVGFVLLITELMETWLSRGQRALVDGLQAG